MTLRMNSQLLNLQPQQVKFYISLHLLFTLVSSLIFNSFQMITSKPLKFSMQVLFAKVRINTLINVKFISSKLPIISVEAGGEESWISDDSCDDVNNNQFCNYDGGDCCGANVIKQYCFECDCLGKLKKSVCFCSHIYGTTRCIWIHQYVKLSSCVLVSSSLGPHFLHWN